jgi:HD-like signal output (HDOD) protein/CheY-like chemotaxis protein
VKHILFVDDERNVLDGIRRLLHGQRERWELHFAGSGEAALEVLAQQRCDVIVSDMRMPGMDGATLLGEVRDRYPDTARLILSGYSEGSLATRAAPVAYRALTKPCNGAELLATLERVCGLQEVFCTPEMRRAIGRVGELPSLSRTYTALAEAIQDPNVSMGMVARIVERDVAMAAKVLQLVNSGFFGLAQPITSLMGAVNYLGMETMKNLALASDTFRVFEPDAGMPRLYFEDLQRHAHRCARILAALPLPARERDVAVVSALLHDIGTLVLASRMPEQFRATRALAKLSGCQEFEAERELLGTSHAEIGAYLLGLWGINELTVEAVAHHHDPTRIQHAGLDSAAAVYVADLLEHELESEAGGMGAQEQACLEAMGLWDELPSLRERAQEAVGAAHVKR